MKRPEKPLVAGAKKLARAQELQRLQSEAPFKWKTRKLVNLEHVRSYISSVINRCEKGELDDQKAARLGALAQTLANVIRQAEVDVLAQRVRELEQRLEATE